MKKTIRNLLLLAVCMAAAAVTAAGCGSTKLADSFDEEQVKKAAQEAAASMDEGDYEGVVGMMREDLQAQITPDQLQAVMDQNFADRGEFKEFKSTAVIGQKVKDTNEDLAVVVLVAEYENQKATYTITFNTDMEMTGFYIK